MSLQGVYTALITPFHENNQIDWENLDSLIKTQINNDIAGLVPCGSTGESPTLTHNEHRECIAKTIEIAKAYNPAVTIIAGAGSNSTTEAIVLSQAAEKDGADYILSVTPYYNKPTQEGLYKHFSRIADSVNIPIILYNIPGRTGTLISLETTSNLAQHPNICGVKDATGDINFMTQTILATQEEKFVLLSGDDNLLLPILSIGGCGIISVASNIIPQLLSHIVNKYLSGDIVSAKERFLEIFPLCAALFCETNPIPIKHAASLLGFCRDQLRLPLTRLTEAHKEVIHNAMVKLNLLESMK